VIDRGLVQNDGGAKNYGSGEATEIAFAGIGHGVWVVDAHTNWAVMHDSRPCAFTLLLLSKAFAKSLRSYHLAMYILYPRPIANMTLLGQTMKASLSRLLVYSAQHSNLQHIRDSRKKRVCVV